MLAVAAKVGVPVIAPVAVIRLYVSPDTSVPVTETFVVVPVKVIVPPVIQGLPSGTSTVPVESTTRLVMDPPPRTNPLRPTCTTPASPARFKLAVAVELPATTIGPQLTKDPPVGMLKVAPALTAVDPP